MCVCMCVFVCGVCLGPVGDGENAMDVKIESWDRARWPDSEET